jgi:hypothetical protein
VLVTMAAPIATTRTATAETAADRGNRRPGREPKDLTGAPPMLNVQHGPF